MLVTHQDIEAAAARLAGRIVDTPLVPAYGLRDLTGRTVWLKLETLQRTRSFKFRGALNALLKITDLGGTLPDLVTASAGNHGAALAAAATQVGASLRVFAPRDAPRAKLDRMRLPGVQLIATCDDYDDAEAQAIDAARAGAVFVSPYNHPDVIAGAGTIALEILARLPGPGAIVVPTGGGGLLSGIAVGAGRATRVVGVEPAVNPAFTASLAAGRITRIAPGTSLADGLVGNLEDGAITFDLVRNHAAGMRLVAEDDIVRGVRALFAGERLVAEGAGAIAVGALLSGVLDDLPDPLVLVISGANIDTARFIQVLQA
jgi:threonine dehydratase